MNELQQMWVIQGGLCFYCEEMTYCSGLSFFTKKSFKRTFKLTKRQVEERLATREHLIRRCEGGDNSLENKVMACNYCNTRREDIPWYYYKMQRGARG